jgi:hypothetical protein
MKWVCRTKERHKRCMNNLIGKIEVESLLGKASLKGK